MIFDRKCLFFNQKCNFLRVESVLSGILMTLIIFSIVTTDYKVTIVELYMQIIIFHHFLASFTLWFTQNRDDFVYLRRIYVKRIPHLIIKLVFV